MTDDSQKRDSEEEKKESFDNTTYSLKSPINTGNIVIKTMTD